MVSINVDCSEQHDADVVQPCLLDLTPEVRRLIYEYVFLQPSGEILASSREPIHDYDYGPPTNWTADSRQQGLVFLYDSERPVPTNAGVLLTCHQINAEATRVFYGMNNIILYAEDNNDIFYWLLDIGGANRMLIRHLEIGWAYGVEIDSGRRDIHGILETIAEMETSQKEETQKHRNELIKVVKYIEKKTVRLIIRTLYLLVANQKLISLAIYLPGVDAGDIWDVPNDNLYFAEEIFSNSTRNVHACVPEAIRKMVGIKTLTIGYTKDIELAQQIARDAGAEELIIKVQPEGHSLGLTDEERIIWWTSGWRLAGDTAHMSLGRHDEPIKTHHSEDWEQGRLKSSMIMRKGA